MPAITTPARMNAHSGAKVLADLLAEQEFADMCVITLDWEGDGFTPALIMDTFKWFPQYAKKFDKVPLLKSQQVMSIDDAFGEDNFDNALAHQMVHNLREEFEAKSQTTPPGWS